MASLPVSPHPGGAFILAVAHLNKAQGVRSVL